MDKKIFTLKLDDDKEISLKWGTFAMKLFCDYRKLTFVEFLNFLDSFLSAKHSVSDVILMLRCAAEYAAGGNIALKDIEIAEWIDQVGGPMLHKGQLKDFAEYVALHTVIDVTLTPASAEINDEEKKT